MTFHIVFQIHYIGGVRSEGFDILEDEKCCQDDVIDVDVDKGSSDRVDVARERIGHGFRSKEVAQGGWVDGGTDLRSVVGRLS